MQARITFEPTEAMNEFAAWRTTDIWYAMIDEDDFVACGSQAFAERYADQNERDYQAFLEGIRSGRLDAATESS